MKKSIFIMVLAASLAMAGSTYAADLQLEWSHKGKLSVLQDMDGDDIYELISGDNDSTSRTIFDAATHMAKWSLNGVSVPLDIFAATEGSFLPTYDLTDDGVNELVCEVTADSSIVIYDVVNSETLYVIDMAGAMYVSVDFWSDLDDDGTIELMARFDYYSDGEFGSDFDSTVTKIYATPPITGVGQHAGALLPEAAALQQNYPNPFNPSTVIAYEVQRTGHVSVTIYNTLGQVVNTLVDANQTAGEYQIEWNGKSTSGESVASGVYFYQLQVGDFASVKKMVVLK